MATDATVLLLAYLVGGVPIGLVVVHLLRPGVDVRHLGTGNVGTSNIFRNAGTRAAVVVGPLQFLQGLVPVLVARAAGASWAVVALAAVLAVVGNTWPVWLGFDGGRGIAVATGAVAGLGLVGLAALLVCYATGLALGEIAAGVLAGFSLLPVVEAIGDGATTCAAAAVLLAVVVLRRLSGVGADIAAHRDQRLAVLGGRLIRDQRPGQTLVGRSARH